MVRRAIAVGVGVLALVLLILAVKGCRDSAREQAFRDYFRDVDGLMQQSNQESRALFGLLTRPGTQSAVQLASNVNGYRGEAAQLVERAKGLDHPDELNAAAQNAVLTLELRRDGIAGIAKELPTALGDAGQEEAASKIAVYMRNFLASDVLYTERVVPGLRKPAKREGLDGELEVPKSHFLTDLGWLSAATVGDRIGRIRSGGSAGPAAPGIHGTGLGTVTVKPGGQTLAQGGAVDIKASPNLSFDVQVMNQGENDETDVPVKVSITGAGKPIVVQQRIPSIAAGQSKTVSIPLAASPPTGRPVTITVQIVGVPGEKNLDNNKGTFAAVFTQ
jgi:CARDB protein